MILLIAGCNVDPEVVDTLDDAFETKPTASGQVQVGQCYEDQYGPNPEAIVRKLDIIIIPDTSGSIIEERAAIADGFDNFINSLPEEVDYRIGVILAHGDSSSYSGKLYQKNSEPLVLDSELMSVADITAALRIKMQNPATHGATDGGEVGIYSLTHAIRDNIDDIRDQGMFRQDAALAVIFVADEQDICFQYPEGIVAVPDPNGKEESTLENLCKNEAGDYLYSPTQIVSELQELQGDNPLVVGGVLYNNLETVISNGENELGYGYLEAIELTGGLSVDMANGDYGQGLSNLGKLAQVSIKPESEFSLSTPLVDETTIEVLVNGVAAAYSYNSELNLVSLTEERDPFSTVRVNYCEKDLPPVKEVNKIIAGGNHNCAILSDGNIKCWGSNNYGQLGIGSTDTIGDDEHPSSIDTLNFGQRVVDAAGGLAHTCVLLEDGDVKCFGRNQFGQLGLGHTDDIGDNETADAFESVPLPTKASKIYAGTNYNCAVLDNKKVKCWGQNSFGQLGYGDTENLGDDEDVSSYSYVDVGADVIKMDISTVSSHTCVVTTSEDLKCWGLNNQGQLGYGHTDTLGDTEVPSSYGYVPFGNKILQVATGFVHTCALSEGQQVRCWGNNNFGQTGFGSITLIGDDEPADSAPYLDFGNAGSKMVTTGNAHSCVIGQDEKVYCFGSGASGQTGLASTNNVGDNETVLGNSEVQIDLALNQVAAGFNHTCVLTKDEGKVICFGDNESGQLGYANNINVGDDESPWKFLELIATP